VFARRRRPLAQPLRRARVERVRTLVDHHPPPHHHSRPPARRRTSEEASDAAELNLALSTGADKLCPR